MQSHTNNSCFTLYLIVQLQCNTDWPVRYYWPLLCCVQFYLCCCCQTRSLLMNVKTLSQPFISSWWNCLYISWEHVIFLMSHHPLYQDKWQPVNDFWGQRSLITSSITHRGLFFSKQGRTWHFREHDRERRKERERVSEREIKRKIKRESLWKIERETGMACLHQGTSQFAEANSWMALTFLGQRSIDLLPCQPLPSGGGRGRARFECTACGSWHLALFRYAWYLSRLKCIICRLHQPPKDHSDRRWWAPP